MSENAEGVYRYLVRYGAPGFVGRFGTIRKIEAPRGTRVVVATDRGLEAGEVLVSADDRDPDADPRPPAGELLRVMTDEDRERVTELAEIHAPILEQCRRLIAERRIDTAVLDGETLLDGRRVILYFLGPATEKLGPLAVELGEASGERHVQFQSLDTATGDAVHVSSTAAAVAARSHEPASTKKVSRQETIKLESAAHWSNIASAIDDFSRVRFSKDEAFLLQLHGVYQQEDRDRRKAASALQTESVDDAPSEMQRFGFMIRTRPPGGRLTAAQMLTHLDLADRYGQGALRITSRQGLQLHGIAKGNVRSVLQAINTSLLTTLGACGDVSRNVMCCPAPLRGDRLRSRLQTLAAEIARHFTPRSSAYHEIWLDEASQGDGFTHDDPVYGATFLPRKFKIGLALPGDNCVDVYTQDIGLIAIAEDERLLGFDVLVGGGLGVSLRRDDTYARLAEPLAFVPAGEELRVIDAIVQIHRDHGNRSDRRRARLKYLIADEGIERFKARVEEQLTTRLAAPRGATASDYDDHLGWRFQGDGRCFLGVPVPCGRVQDDDQVRLKTAVRRMLERFVSPVRLTPQQNLLLCDLERESQKEIEQVFSECGVTLVDALTPLRRHAMACPALPTCGLALAEAERIMPRLLAELEQEIVRRGLSQEPFALRVAGCPNACVRTATAEIAIIGQGVGKYAIHVGGELQGGGLNGPYREDVAQDQLAKEVASLLMMVQHERRSGESIGVCLGRLRRADQE